MSRWAFIVSGILFFLAVVSAYPPYLEGKTAQDNSQLLLMEFEQIVLKTEQTNSLSQMQISVPSTTREIVEAPQSTIEPVKKVALKYTPIAKLEIDKIGLNVSVLSEWSYELLEISVNKFHGPEPNELGNFIVIGHNYNNGAHFGKLHLLEIGDEIELTDLTGRKLTYEVYEMLKIKPTEVEKLSTNNERTLTLATCDKDNAWRVVVKSKESNK